MSCVPVPKPQPTTYCCTGCKKTSTDTPPDCGCGVAIVAKISATATGVSGIGKKSNGHG